MMYGEFGEFHSQSSSSLDYSGSPIIGSQSPLKSSQEQNRRDLNNYAPMQTFPIFGNGTRISVVGNQGTDETIFATLSNESINIYCLKTKGQKTKEDENQTVADENLLELNEVHELTTNNFVLLSFAISTCSITLLPKSLIYAVGTQSDEIPNAVFLYHLHGDTSIPASVHLSKEVITSSDSSFKSFINVSPSVKLALQEDKYIACVLENQTVVVWDISNNVSHVTFPLKSNGVHVAWHPTEPLKLMIVEANGWIKFYNIYKQCCFMSLYVGRAPLYSADWALTNSLIAVVGWSGGYTIINTSQPNSNMYKTFEHSQKNISKVKFNSTDERCIATFGRSPGVLRLWRNHFSSHIWSHNSNQIQDIAWMHGKPFIIALYQNKIKIYDGSD